MRCEEKTGFLMLHRCENVAETQCSDCGKKICTEHRLVVGETPMTDGQGAGLPPPESRVVVCPECFRKREGQTAAQGAPGMQGAPGTPQTGQVGDRYADRDPYYHYPYYGSYHPYYWGGGYDDRDRQVFDRDRSNETAADADALGS